MKHSRKEFLEELGRERWSVESKLEFRAPDIETRPSGYYESPIQAIRLRGRKVRKKNANSTLRQKDLYRNGKVCYVLLINKCHQAFAEVQLIQEVCF
ncbi:hypothetical protein AVEN_80724-1 [Araneus ventricosus]|uniref:Uncharacterized protein n=1 Tax=Araneus ventricosus TaxID=182803 RepID=A0A4Y2UBY3_ARAVE|nr:hypothetical protein AVEN_80724-1 [Araneus ventricosus]